MQDVQALVEAYGRDSGMSPGGRIGLDELLTEHAEAIEADLLRYYGVDLLDHHRGTLSARRVSALIRHPPRDSALARALHGGEATWGDACARW